MQLGGGVRGREIDWLGDGGVPATYICKMRHDKLEEWEILVVGGLVFESFLLLGVKECKAAHTQIHTSHIKTCGRESVMRGGTAGCSRGGRRAARRTRMVRLVEVACS